MPTDLQIIDGFERLRSEFIESNPSVPLRTNSRASSDMPTVEEALEAWLKTTLGLDGASGQERRWLRALVKLTTDEGASISAAESNDSGLSSLIRRHRGLLARAKKVAARLAEMSRRDGRVAFDSTPANLAAEADAWATSLPGLAGLKSWRMLEHLGRAIVVPDQPIQRFFWRFGLLEESPDSNGFPQAAACIEKSLQVTGMHAEEMGRLLAWHTRATPNLFGGHRCGAKPDCEACPFAAGCVWVRFGAQARASESDEERAREESEHLRRVWEEQETEDIGDSELLAMLLQGSKGERPLRLAEDLLRRFDGLKGIDLASVEELAHFKGIGPARARQIKSAVELGRRISLAPIKRGFAITQSHEVWAAYRERFRHIPQEHFIVLLLDTKNRLIQTHIVSKGSLNSSSAHPREVFKQAIRQSASGIILMHNHPSGDPDPSPEDHAVTDQLVESGKILGIRVLDHIILGGETYYSFRDSGDI